MFSLPWLGSVTKPKNSLVVELNENGQITRSLHDPTGSIVPDASEIHDEGDALWLGSYHSKFIGKLDLKD